VSLEVRSVQFAFGSGSPLFDDYSAVYSEGEMVALTGHSGRGKSTLLYILGLMLKPTGGSIRLDGRDTSTMPDAARARLRAALFGFVFQDAALDSTRSVLDNVLESSLYRRTSRAAERPYALSLMNRLGVAARADAKPGQLSGGQAQRIALCRALVSRPRFVLADEPTGNLDASTGDVVVEALRHQAQSGSLVIIATHDPRVVAKCDRVVSL
jgi:ABC-type lipoprotein export system ATPase subunit